MAITGFKMVIALAFFFLLLKVAMAASVMVSAYFVIKLFKI